MAEAVNTDELVVTTTSYLFQNGQTTMPPHRVWAFYCMISKIIAPGAFGRVLYDQGERYARVRWTFRCGSDKHVLV